MRYSNDVDYLLPVYQPNIQGSEKMTSMDAIFAEPCSILYLLPYTGQSQLVSKKQKLDDLYFIQTVVGFTIVALETFLSGDLVAFDAQVGENLCQIRAYKTLLLAREHLDSDTKKLEFAQKINQIKLHKTKLNKTICDWENAIYKAKSYCKNLDSHESIEHFLKRHNLYFALDEDLIYFVACHFLSHFSICRDKNPVAINVDHIKHEFHISKYRAKKLTDRYQILVSKLGSDFIMTIVNELPNKLEYIKILPAVRQIAEEGRVVLPCLMATDILLQHCWLRKISLLMVVNWKNEHNITSDHLYFTLSPSATKWEFSLYNNKSTLHHVMVIRGNKYPVDGTAKIQPGYLQKILELGIRKILLANTASHPQYAGSHLLSLRNNPFQNMPLSVSIDDIKPHSILLNDLRKFAFKYGCSKENQSILYMEHVYASNFDYEIEKLLAYKKEKALESHDFRIDKEQP